MFKSELILLLVLYLEEMYVNIIVTAIPVFSLFLLQFTHYLPFNFQKNNNNDDVIMHRNGTAERGWTKWVVMKTEHTQIVESQPGKSFSLLVYSYPLKTGVLSVSPSPFSFNKP